MLNLGHSIRSNTLWILTGTVSGQILTFVFGVILARLLVPADFGLLVTIQIFTGLAGFVAGGGMGEALVQAKTVVPRDYRVVFTVQLIVCTLIYIGFYFIAPWFSVWFQDPLYEPLLRVAALYFLLRPFLNIPRAQLRRDMRFKNIAINRFVGMLFGSIVSVILAILDMGPWSLILGGLAGSVVNIALFYATTRWIPALAYDWETARRLGGYGVRMSANEIVRHFREQTANLLISRTMGPDPVGLFNKADSLSALPARTIGGSAYQTVFRALATVQENLDKSQYIYFRTVSLVAVYTLPFYVGLAWLAGPFIVGVYGPSWAAAATPLQILAATGVFRCITNPSGAVIAAQNRLGAEFRIQLEVWLVLAIGVWQGLEWGIVGVAWGLLPSFLYGSIRMFFLARKCVGGGIPQLLKALTPALGLCSWLAALLVLVDRLLPSGWDAERPLLYVLAMGGIGALAYTGAFLYAPIPALKGERERWRRRLHLP